jgi:hypothetical protein
MENTIEFEVLPCANVPAGLPRQRLEVLSPVWQGEMLLLEYPDGSIHTLRGLSGPEPGEPCRLRIFWTRHHPHGPPVVLAIGGGHGLQVRNLSDPDAPAQGRAFLALAESLVPREVLEVIGPAPSGKDREILLLA